MNVVHRADIEAPRLLIHTRLSGKKYDWFNPRGWLRFESRSCLSESSSQFKCWWEHHPPAAQSASDQSRLSVTPTLRNVRRSDLVSPALLPDLSEREGRSRRVPRTPHRVSRHLSEAEAYRRRLDRIQQPCDWQK
jgi:hypothetical protein